MNSVRVLRIGAFLAVSVLLSGCGGGPQVTDAIDPDDSNTPADVHEVEPGDEGPTDTGRDIGLDAEDAAEDADANVPTDINVPTDTNVPKDTNICVPNCVEHVCGMDPVCGSKDCGTCNEGFTCKEGKCEENICVPDCGNRKCGMDPVCGTQDCGTCDDGYSCKDGECEENICVPDCKGNVCGKDPTCGTQDCGTCDEGFTCKEGKCEEKPCVPDCGTRECGMDPVCGTLNCGTCDDGDSCQDGTCIPNGMVPVPAGKFSMGCNASVDSDCDDDEKPYHEVTLSAYFIDKTEVTQAAYKLCLDAGNCNAPACDWNPAGAPNRPVVCVTWTQARGYCEWAGKRLPTEAEWEMAARGTDGRIFPWGDLSVTCNYAVKDGCPGDVKDVCSKSPDGDSPYGLCDMSGNVWEWVSDWYSSGYYVTSPSSNPTGPASGAERVRRSGSFEDVSHEMRTSYRDKYSPGNWSDAIGFRCVKDIPAE